MTQPEPAATARPDAVAVPPAAVEPAAAEEAAGEVSDAAAEAEPGVTGAAAVVDADQPAREPIDLAKAEEPTDVVDTDALAAADEVKDAAEPAGAEEPENADDDKPKPPGPLISAFDAGTEAAPPGDVPDEILAGVLFAVVGAVALGLRRLFRWRR